VSKSPSDETHEGALLFPLIDEKWSIDRRLLMFLEYLKKKMRAFRPASRRHDGSAGGIATAATCALIDSTFLRNAEPIQICDLLRARRRGPSVLPANRHRICSKTLRRYIIQ